MWPALESCGTYGLRFHGFARVGKGLACCRSVWRDARVYGESRLAQTFALVLPDARQNRNISEAGVSYDGNCGLACGKGQGRAFSAF